MSGAGLVPPSKATMIKSFTRWLVRCSITDYQDVDNVRVRARYGSLEAWTSIVVNILLFGVKLALGLTVKSVAIVADAVHTLSDCGTSVIILIGFGIAKRPGDREHPFGHGRMESIATLVVGVLLIVTGFEVLKSSAERIVHPEMVTARIDWLVVGVLSGAILLKEVLARFARQLGLMVKSKTLEADFRHHRSDVFSTVLVLVAIACGRLGLSYADGVAGVAVAIIVMYCGYMILRDATSGLLGERPSPEFLAQIEKTALLVQGVRGVHDVIVHRYGQINLVSLHIEVLDTASAGELHNVSERVEEAVSGRLGGSAVVHIDPLNASHPRYADIRDRIVQVTAGKEPIESFHDLRVGGVGPDVQAEFDIVVNDGVVHEDVLRITKELRDELAAILPDVKIAIKTEPRYAYSHKEFHNP